MMLSNNYFKMAMEQYMGKQRVISLCSLLVIPGLGLLLLLAGHSSAAAMENAIFSGRVVDVEQEPVAGVEIFVYDTDNTRRPADFISPPTDTSGEFHILLPPGEYFTVARLRHGQQRFGPLLPGDKHSGAPLEIELAAGETIEEEFVVADLEETSLLAVKVDTSFIRVEGILQTAEGEPVANAYAVASSQETLRRIPDYVSAWTDSSGRYVLFLPEGTYFLGGAHTFPPGEEIIGLEKVSIDSSTKNINIVTEK